MPATSARSAARAVAVLDQFTTNPGRPFTLSELAAAVGASLSSLSSVLHALVDGGYLVRHPRHKTYELGPALVAVGRAASVRHPVVDLAKPVLARLAERHEADCLGSVMLRDEIIVLAVEGPATQFTRGMVVGHRIPLTPPFGSIWMAYRGPDAVQPWLRSATSGTDDPETVARMQDALRAVRARGYAVALRSEPLATFHEVVTAPTPRAARVARERLRAIAATIGSQYELLRETPETTYEPEMVIALVFGPDGDVVFAITLVGLAPRTGAQITRIADDVVEAGLGLTRVIGGRAPSCEADRTAS